MGFMHTHQFISSFVIQIWIPREDELRKIRSVQNKMLRRICHTPRHPTEEWAPWIKRATHRARQLAQEAGVRDWLQAHAARKWHWAGHAARREASTWLWRITFWRDSDWNAGALEAGLWRPLRPSRRRWMKWEDPLRRFMSSLQAGAWSRVASDRELWSAHADEFVQWFVESGS